MADKPMTMIEKIARAIKAELAREMEAKPLFGDASSGDWYSDGSSGAINLETVARAAVEAMREPTENMKYVGRPFLNEAGMAYAGATWGAMIDAILNEKG